MAISWVEIYKKYKGLWVALADDEKTVIASGLSAKEAYEKAREKGVEVPIVMGVPSSPISYVG